MLDVIKYLHSFLVCRSTQKFSIRLCGGGTETWQKKRRKKISWKTIIIYYNSSLILFSYSPSCQHSIQNAYKSFSSGRNWKIFNRKDGFV